MLHLLVILVVTSFALAAPQSRLVKKDLPVETYVIVNGPMTWHQAKTECANIGRFLAQPRSVEENNAIKSLYVSGQYWLGITDIAHEGTFTYCTDDTNVVYANFDGGQPDNFANNEHCTEMWNANGLWNDIPCDSVRGHAVCELWHGGHGDPHMRTFDGRAYSFQGACWYSLFKECTDHSGFEVTTKFEPREDSTPDRVRTRIVAFNVTVGDQYALVEGLDISTGRTGGLVTDAKAITIQEKEKEIIVHFTSRNTTFSVAWTLRKHALSVSYYGSFYHGKLCGLMGNADGEAGNDFQKPDGSIAKDVVEFGESWKVNEKKCD